MLRYNQVVRCPFPSCDCKKGVISSIGSLHYTVRCLHRNYCNVLRNELEALNSPDICPICLKNIKFKNDMIEKHDHNGEVCYGSYIPRINNII